MNTMHLATTSKLTELLRDQAGSLAELLDLLERETAALASGGHERVLHLADDKQRLGLRLAELFGSLQRLLSSAGYPDDTSGLASCVEDSADPRLAQLHAAALERLTACALRNEANGRLVNRRRSAAERALRVLLDQSASGGSVYYPSGHLEGIGANRLLGEA